MRLQACLPGRGVQRGIAAIELAAILPVMILLLGCTLFLGRVFWHYTAAHKAAHDAARYLSSVSAREMSNSTRTGNAVLVAHDIAQAETEGLNPGPDGPSISVLCDGLICDGFSLPATITVGVRLAMYDEMLFSLTSDIIGQAPFVLTASVTMRYVGK